jgi:hypothetical protein
MNFRAITPELIEQLQSIKKCEDDWDGDGAVKPKHDHVDKIIEVITTVPFDVDKFHVMLARDGEVGVYHSSNDNYLEIAIDHNDDRVVVYSRNFNNEHGQMYHLIPYTDLPTA